MADTTTPKPDDVLRKMLAKKPKPKSTEPKDKGGDPDQAK